MTTTQETLVERLRDVARDLGDKEFFGHAHAVLEAADAILALTTPPIDDIDKHSSSNLAESNQSRSPVIDFDDITYAGAEVPEGWRLVPVEPTEEMLAASGMYLGGDDYDWTASQVWSAMLKSSPDYKGGER